jgi:hypothetical protein
MSAHDQWRRIERRLPSPSQRLALAVDRGIAFKVPSDDLTQDFIPMNEAMNVYGGPDGWVAHMLLKTCAGREQDRR